MSAQMYRPSGMPRSLLRGALGLVFGYSVFAGLVGCAQRSLIYHPPALAPGEMEEAASRARFVPWTNSAGVRVGWHRPGSDAGSKGAVLILHGNAGAAAERGYLADPLQEGTGLDVYVMEYPGFAGRPGKPSETSLGEAALEAFDLLATKAPVYLVGESLGTGVAAIVAGSRADRVSGLILLTPFDSLVSAAGHHYPWLPVRMLLRDRYDSVEWLRRYHGPVGVVIGTGDQVVPAELGRRLHDAYSGPKRLWQFDGESHWDASHRPASWWHEAIGFLDRIRRDS